jgi:hypothetical protein
MSFKGLRAPKWRYIILLCSAIVILAAALAAYLTSQSFDTTLEVTIYDKVSGRWVWNLEATIQNRKIIAFYQSGATIRTFQFTQLRPGTYTLECRAPHYAPETREVQLKRGKNALAEPIEMTGYEIPQLKRFVVFEERRGDNLIAQLRPIGEDGRAIINHPCVDIWIGCQISTQLMSGDFAPNTVETKAMRGDILFQNMLEWRWDAQPESTFRYLARIPTESFRAHNVPLVVIDYLIVVPDPRKISREEMEVVMGQAFAIEEAEKIAQYLDQFAGALKYYLHTSWDVSQAN